jgi:hypothetical protein
MNKQEKAVALFGGVLIAGMLVASGCDWRERIEVKAPAAIPEVLDFEPPLMLADAERAYEEWTAWVERTDAAFVASIEKAEERYQFVHQWTSVGLSVVGTASEGIPYGGLLFGALTGAVGLMLPQPKMPKKKEPPKP